MLPISDKEPECSDQKDHSRQERKGTRARNVVKPVIESGLSDVNFNGGSIKQLHFVEHLQLITLEVATLSKSGTKVMFRMVDEGELNGPKRPEKLERIKFMECNLYQRVPRAVYSLHW